MSDEICPFDRIHCRVPRKKINKFYWGTRHLPDKESAFFRSKLDELEKIIFKAQHAKSAVEKILQRDARPEPAP